MFGKVLKISSNDLYGNVYDRVVRLYACFQHIKYNNNYAVFSFEGETNKLYFGSIHMKKNALVIFAVKDNIKEFIMEFLDEYTNSNLNVGVVFNSTNAIFFPSCSSTSIFSVIYLSISFCDSTYPITLPSIATWYCGVYFINTIAITIIKAIETVLSTFNNSFV